MQGLRLLEAIIGWLAGCAVKGWRKDGDVRCVHELSSSDIRDLVAAFRGNVAAFRHAPTNDKSRPR